MKTYRIIKIKRSGKWLELWLEGLPFEKVTIWDEVNECNAQTEDNKWNFCTKSYKLEQAFRNAYPKIDLYERLDQKGLDFYVGFRISVSEKSEVEGVFE